MKYVDSPPAKGGQLRVSSPFPGSSILMTSAPMSPSIIEQNGPARTRVRSRTRTPTRGWSARDTLSSFPGSLGEAPGDRVHAVTRTTGAPPEEAGAGPRAGMGEVVDVVHRPRPRARGDAGAAPRRARRSTARARHAPAPAAPRRGP